jgi:hypothetical protein
MIARDEWRWVAAWATVALLAANAPILLGWALSTPETQFGGSTYNVEDVNSYLANMRQGAQGAWLYHNPYTPEAHPGTLVYLHYLLLGKLAAWSGLSLEGTYHLARVLCGALLLVVAYLFIARFTPHRAVRRIAFLLIVFSGGLGWVLIVLEQPGWQSSLPVDLISPEGYTFLTLYSPPHIALATAGVLGGVLCVFEAMSCPRVGFALVGSLILAIVAQIGAFYLVAPFAALGVYWAIIALHRRRPDWRALGMIVIASLLPAALAGYTLAVFGRNPVYRAWAAQNQVRSPHPLHYLAGYAIAGTLALLGAVHAVRKRQRQLVLPLAWTALVPVLLYLPVNVQRRLIIGAPVPIGLLAGCGLACCVALPFGRSSLVRRLSRHPRYSRQGMRRLLVGAVVLLTALTNMLLIGGNCIAVTRRAPPVYHSAAELAALDWLRANTTPQDTVLSSYKTGNYVPARAGNRVVLGLGTQTVDAERKKSEVRRFFDTIEEDDWRQALLARYGVAYVLVGPHERALGSFDPGSVSYLRVVYHADGYAIYQVVSVDR